MALTEPSTYRPATSRKLCGGTARHRTGVADLARNRPPLDSLPRPGSSGPAAAAGEARDNFKPGFITYSRKVFLPLDQSLPRLLRILHLPPRSRQAGRAHHDSGRSSRRSLSAGEKLGCTEALFSLGDKPELLFPEMRDTLRHLGYKSTLHYLEAMCELVLRETSFAAASQSRPAERRVDLAPGGRFAQHGAHARKHELALCSLPARPMTTLPTKFQRNVCARSKRLGSKQVPFTTGLLIGIGETAEDRVDTLIAIRDLHERYGHIQEVIVQNFRAKPGIPMAQVPEPSAGRNVAHRCCGPLADAQC